MNDAVIHCTRGAGIWEWASTDNDRAFARRGAGRCGDIPTLETLAAVT